VSKRRGTLSARINFAHARIFNPKEKRFSWERKTFFSRKENGNFFGFYSKKECFSTRKKNVFNSIENAFSFGFKTHLKRASHDESIIVRACCCSPCAAPG
jgi:hypothetical protein